MATNRQLLGPYLLGLLALFGSAATVAVAEQTAQPEALTEFAPAVPLFDTLDTPLTVTLTGPWSRLARDKAASPKRHAATLELADGRQLKINVKPRGRSRRLSENCAFPPLQLDFKRRDLVGSVFAGQNKLKLVTHCGQLGTTKKRFSDQLHSEYLLYRIFNRLTQSSFKVRLLNITWVDSQRGKTFTHPGFVIEHKNALAQRLAATQVERPNIPLAQLDPDYSALSAMFAYFSGNTDFSFTSGPPGDDCCHNALPLARIGGGPMLAVPYDFDATGFVNPAYARPAAGVGVDRVTQRLHRGYCEHASVVPLAVVKFQRAKPYIIDLLTNYAAISNSRRKKLLRYTRAFYAVLDNPKALNKKLLSRCR